MRLRVELMYGDTFRVIAANTDERVGEITLMSGGWAAYRAGSQDRRIGTYDSAEQAVLALEAETA